MRQSSRGTAAWARKTAHSATRVGTHSHLRSSGVRMTSARVSSSAHSAAAPVCERETEWVSVCVWEREKERERKWERVYVCERKRVCVRMISARVSSLARNAAAPVCERERVWMWVCVWERERECMCEWHRHVMQLLLCARPTQSIMYFPLLVLLDFRKVFNLSFNANI